MYSPPVEYPDIMYTIIYCKFVGNFGCCVESALFSGEVKLQIKARAPVYNRRVLRGAFKGGNPLLCDCCAAVQEDFSDEEDGKDEDLSAALATLRMQQEARTKEGGARRPGHGAGSVDGASEDAAPETAILTQVVNLYV